MVLQDAINLVISGNSEIVYKAISSKTRRKILEILEENFKENKPFMNITDLALMLGQTISNMSAQLKILDKACLIKYEFIPGHHGVQKLLFALRDDRYQKKDHWKD